MRHDQHNHKTHTGHHTRYDLIHVALPQSINSPANTGKQRKKNPRNCKAFYGFVPQHSSRCCNVRDTAQRQHRNIKTCMRRHEPLPENIICPKWTTWKRHSVSTIRIVQVQCITKYSRFRYMNSFCYTGRKCIDDSAREARRETLVTRESAFRCTSCSRCQARNTSNRHHLCG
jgi:hypothetical protein